MEGEGMVAVVRGLPDAGLAVTLIDSNRQYTLLPNSITLPAQRAPVSSVNASTQPTMKLTTDSSTEAAAPPCDRDSQAVDGRYASMYKMTHCNLRPTSPPVQLTEFPPQRPEVYPGHGNFQVGGAGSGAIPQIRPTSPVMTFRGGMSWPDRGSVCSPRASHEIDAFANSLRKYPCLSPDRSSEVIERLVNYPQAKGLSKTTTRNPTSPTRYPDVTSHHALEVKPVKTQRPYEPEVTIRAKKYEDPPTRDRKRPIEDHHDLKLLRNFDVRCIRDMSKRIRDSVKTYSNNPCNQPSLTMKENHDNQPVAYDCRNSSNSVNMEIQAAVKMISKQVSTVQRELLARKTVAVPEHPSLSAVEDNVEGDSYLVPNLEITTSMKSIQTTFCSSDVTLKPKKSVQTVSSTLALYNKQERIIIGRKTKSQELIKVTKDDLKISLLELIEEVSNSTKSKKMIREELIKKLFVSDRAERRRNSDSVRPKSKLETCHKYASTFCPTACDYVGDFHELVGKLKHCYGDTKYVWRSEVKPFRISEYRQLDFVIKDWVNNLNLEQTKYMDRDKILNSVEDRIKELLKIRTTQDFDLRSGIVSIIEELPINVNKSYNRKSYLNKLVDVLLRRMKNVVSQPTKVRKKADGNRAKMTLNEDDIRDFVRAHLVDFFYELDLSVTNDNLDDIENEFLDVMVESLDCIRYGHVNDAMNEMDCILQDLTDITIKQANDISNYILQELHELLSNCNFNQTYMILTMNNNTEQVGNQTNNTDGNDQDLRTNLEQYISQLSSFINEWLDTLDVPEIQDKGFREVVVNDLAGDIVDRHKYKQINPGKNVTEEDELEALKYQIFKWINKLVGDENQETIANAKTLLEKINSVPVPALTNHKKDKQPFDPMRPCLGETGPNTCTEQNIRLFEEPCCTRTEKLECPPNELCCSKLICKNVARFFGYDSKDPTSLGTDADGLYGDLSGAVPKSYTIGQLQGKDKDDGNDDEDKGDMQSVYGKSPGMMGDAKVGYHLDRFKSKTNKSDLSTAGTSSSPNSLNLDSSAAIRLSKINQDYDAYLKNWVEQIPIEATTAAEQQAAEKAKLGVYNGIWKAMTKMKLDPKTFNNPYYFQDAFDNEVEKLFKNLPKSEKLEAAKSVLKTQLLQKTTTMNDQIKTLNAPASYKQRLTDNIQINLPKSTFPVSEEEKQQEEIDRQDLTDYFVLHTRYKDDDSAKAAVHKKNFSIKLDKFVNDYKKRHNLTDMDTEMYKNEIINSLEKVPTPDFYTLKNEGDDILLAMEVDNWIDGLPKTVGTTSPTERRKMRNAIFKKVQESSADGKYNDSSFIEALKAEIPKSLEKMTLQKDANVDFMVEELANRVRNVSKNSQARPVSFGKPSGYDEFSKNIPSGSTFGEPQDGRWQSMQATQGPSAFRNWSEQPQAMETQPYMQNITDPMPGSYPAGGYISQKGQARRYQLRQDGLYQQGQDRPYQKGQERLYQQEQDGPYQQGQDRPYQKGQDHPYHQVQDRLYQQGQDHPYQQEQEGPYQPGQDRLYQQEQDGPYQKGQERLYQQGKDRPYQQGQDRPYQQGQDGPYQPWQDGLYQQGHDSLYQQGQDSNYQQGQDGPYQKGQVRLYQKGQEHLYQQGQDRPYQKRQDRRYQQGQDGPYQPWQDGLYQQGHDGLYQQGQDSPYQQVQYGPYQPRQDRLYQQGQDGLYQQGQDSPYQQVQYGSYQPGQDRIYQQEQDRLYQQGQDRPYQKRQDRPYQPGQDGPYQPGQDRPYQKGQDGPFQPGQDGPYQQGQDGPYQPGQDRPYQKGQDGPYQQGQDSPYQPGQDRPYQKGQDGPYQPGQDRPYQQGQDRSYQQGQDGPYQPGQDRSYQQGQDGPYQPGQDRPYQKGQDRIYQYGQDGPYQPGRDDTYQQGQDGPYQPGQDHPYQKIQDHLYQQGQDDPYQPGQHGPYQKGQDRLYQQGQDGPYQPGQDGPYQPGQDGPYQPGQDRRYQPGQDRPYQQGHDPLYQQGQDRPYQQFQEPVGQGVPYSTAQGGKLCSGGPYCPNKSCPNRPRRFLEPGSYSLPGQSQYTAGPHGQGISSGTVPNAGMYGSVQGGQSPYNQSIGPVSSGRQSFGPAGPSYGQVAPGVSYGHSDGGQIPGQEHRDRLLSKDQIRCPGRIGVPIGPVYQGPYGQTLPNTMTNAPYAHESSFSPTGPNVGVDTQSGMHSPTLNQTSQSPGPISAASQAPDQLRRAGVAFEIPDPCQQPGPCPRTTRIPNTRLYPGAAHQDGVRGSRFDYHKYCFDNSQFMDEPEDRPIGQPIPKVMISAKEPRRTGRRRRRMNIDDTDTSTDKDKLKYDQLIRLKPGIKSKQNTPKEETNPIDFNDKGIINFKSVQTASSTIDIKTTKCKYCEIRSKSQEELTKITRKQEVIKRRDFNSGDLQQDVTEWFEIHSDKVKVKLWGEKLKKLADRLKKPGGEEKLRIKIEKYLNQVPDSFPDGDDDRIEFRRQLPNDIIQKLKMMYLTPTDNIGNVNRYRMEGRKEVPKYGSRFKIDNIKKVVQCWTNTLSIKKKDFMGRYVKKEDVIKYVTDKLEPLVLDRPQSDLDYKLALKSCITDIIDEIPVTFSNQNKESHLNKVTDNLVDEIYDIESKFPSTYIQPTTKEIKDFVRDEITFFLDKSRIGISTKRMEHIETELFDILLDLTEIKDLNSQVTDVVTAIFRELGKLPESRAKYFSNLLLKDYKDFFFREGYYEIKDYLDRGLPEVYSTYQNATGMVDFGETTSYNKYTQRVIEKINKWVTQFNIPNNDKNCIEGAVKDLAHDIVERHKYLYLNPSITRTDAEELHHLKFLIFKLSNRLLGDDNTSVLEHVQELINEINKVPKPSFQNIKAVNFSDSQTNDIPSETKLYIDKINDQIFEWYSELPSVIRAKDDVNRIKMSIKDLAENIENGLTKKEDGVIDKEVDKWIDKIFDTKLSNYDIKQLKNRISNVPHRKEDRRDSKHQKVLIRTYEDIVDEWIDTVPIAPKIEEIFINNKNEIVHEIAVKIYKIKSKVNNLSREDVEKKLHAELSDWLKKLPLHVKFNKQDYRDNFAAKLVRSIQMRDMTEALDSEVNELEDAILEWLKNLTFYKIKSPKEKEREEEVMKELAKNIDQSTAQEVYDLDEDITKHIKLLDPLQNDACVDNMSTELKSYLQRLNLITVPNPETDDEDEFLVSTVENWLKELPLNITDVNRFILQKRDFIKNIQNLISSGSDNIVMKKEILVFMETLPMCRGKKDDIVYLSQEAQKIIESITAIPITAPSGQLTPKCSDMIGNIIKEWTKSLPLITAYCSKDLRPLIDDMSLVITTILLDPQYCVSDDKDMELHREIVQFLARFPIQHEGITERDIDFMADKLIGSVKDMPLIKNENHGIVNNVTVYGVQLENTHRTDGFNINNIKESDLNENLEKYTKELIQQISEWFDCLNIPDIQKQDCKEVVINDLAGDIADRQKYLELNPNKARSKEDELENLKYQIFKWINKLVGEDNNETIEHADDLMKRINKIPVPMLVKPQSKSRAQSPSLPIHQSSKSYTIINEDNSYKEQKNNSPQSVANPILIKEASKQNNDPQSFCSQACSNNVKETPPEQQASAQSIKNPSDIADSKVSFFLSEDQPSGEPDETSKEGIYAKYQKIFRKKCDALPLDSSTPENAKLAEIAKTAIYNGIVKTFFNLKSDPEIDSDYGYFEFMLEEKLEEMLDVLSQSQELVNIRDAWKLDILKNAMNMLDHLHTLSDRPSFRQRVRNKFNRQFAKDLELEQCFLLQQGFLAELADAYILETNYKEKDVAKKNVYRYRLMKKVDELANHLAKEHNVGFRFFNKAHLAHIAMKVLEQVPIPKDDILQEEAEEIQLADVVEKWYDELPTKALVNDTDEVLRKRMVDLLAKKLYDIQKRLNDSDPSKDSKMKHEISLFLENRAHLQLDQDLNINLMVDELHNRLNNKCLNSPLDYDDLQKNKPISSTFAQVNTDEFINSLIDAGTSTGPQEDQGYTEPDDQDMYQEHRYYIPHVLMQAVAPNDNSQGAGLYGANNNESKFTAGEQHRRYDDQENYDGFYSRGASYMQNQDYISQQEAAMHNMDPTLLRRVSRSSRMNQKSPGEGYAPQLTADPIQNILMSTSQKNGYISKSNVPRSGTSYQSGKFGHNPHLMGRYARMQNINQILNPNGLTDEGEIQEHLFDQNKPKHDLYGQRNRLFVPRYRGTQGRPMDFRGYPGSRGSIHSQGASSNVPIQPKFPILGEDIDDGLYVKCRCLEAYRRRRKMLETGEKGDRYKPYEY